jgi:hypothetical protein
MAQAANQHTTNEWDLTRLHRYLCEELHYRIEPALRAIEEGIATGRVDVEVQEFARGKSLGDPVNVNPLDFDNDWTLKFDPYAKEVRVVRKVPRLEWHAEPYLERRYTIREQAARLAWPPRPAASQTAPDQQPEDKAGPDPFRTGGAGRPTAAHLIRAEAKRRIAEKEVRPTLGGLAAFSEDLGEWWANRQKTFNMPSPSMKAETIRNVVRDLWNAAVRGAQN